MSEHTSSTLWEGGRIRHGWKEEVVGTSWDEAGGAGRRSRATQGATAKCSCPEGGGSGPNSVLGRRPGVALGADRAAGSVTRCTSPGLLDQRGGDPRRGLRAGDGGIPPLERRRLAPPYGRPVGAFACAPSRQALAGGGDVAGNARCGERSQRLLRPDPTRLFPLRTREGGGPFRREPRHRLPRDRPRLPRRPPSRSLGCAVHRDRRFP